MRLKRLAFAVLSLALFFGLSEAALWLFGVRPLAAERDPLRGFSPSVRVFEPADGGRELRTVERAVRHSFRPQRFLAEKPSAGLRLFVIGGSSAYGFPWGAESAFCALLGRALERTGAQSGPVEAINAAAMSYGSHRLRILAAELVRYDPDLLVVYGGHNEFVERRFHRELLEREATLDPLRGALANWRLYSWLTRGWERLSREGAPAVPEPREDGEPDGGELLGFDVAREYESDVREEEREAVVRLFRENLEAIVALAAEHDVRLVLATVPSNLAGWPPNQSLFDVERPPAVRERVEQALERGRRALEAGEPGRAVALLAGAVGAAPEHAAAWYWHGRALVASDRPAEALAAFRRARDADARPSRAPTAINDAIRDVAAERRRVILADVERAFEALSPAGPGFDLFEDYVHPKPEGHAVIAHELWRALRDETALVARARRSDDSVFWEAIGRPAGPALGDPLAPAAGSAARSTPPMLFNLAVVLEHQGLVEQAMDKYRTVLELDPGYVTAQTNLARLLLRAGRIAEAEEQYRLAVAKRPDHLRAWLGLGQALRRGGRPGEAAGAFREALARDDASAPAWDGLGGALAQLGRHAEAEQAYRRVVALDPENADARVNLGFALFFQQDLDQAEATFRDALARRADHVRARNGLAAVLTERGRWDEAERLFRESLRLAPGDESARGGLALLERRRSAG